jgi:hypothetical protein
VTDHIVQAKSCEVAVDRLMQTFEKRAVERGIELESDGSYGYFYGCDCDIPEEEADYWECSHGGITVQEPDEIQAFATYEEAEAARATYHCLEVIE